MTLHLTNPVNSNPTDRLIYEGNAPDLAAQFVIPPDARAVAMEAAAEAWMQTPNHDHSTPFGYHFNTSSSQTPGAVTYPPRKGEAKFGTVIRDELEGYAKDGGLDIVAYQLLDGLPGGSDAQAEATLAAYETVAFWGGVTGALAAKGYDIRLILVDEAGGIPNGSALGLTEQGVATTLQDLRQFASQYGAGDRVVIRPMNEMFESSHARALADIDEAGIAQEKADVLRGDIATRTETIQTARVKLLLGQLTARDMEAFGLTGYLDEHGTIPEDLALADLPRPAVEYIVSLVTAFDAKMTLRKPLIADAAERGTDLPELGVPGRHAWRVGTTKSADRHAIRLVRDGKDARGRTIQVPYAVPVYAPDGGQEVTGFARNVDLKGHRYGIGYFGYDTIYSAQGRPLALVPHKPEKFKD